MKLQISEKSQEDKMLLIDNKKEIIDNNNKQNVI